MTDNNITEEDLKILAELKEKLGKEEENNIGKTKKKNKEIGNLKSYSLFIFWSIF